MANKKVVYAELLLVVVTIIWGLGFPITKIAVNMGYGANTIMVGRFFTASIILSGVYYKKLKKINKTILKYGIITGVFLFLGFYFQTLGNVYTTPSKNGFITQLNIVFVPFLYYLFFRKKVDIYNIISVIIAVIGMLILSFNSEGFSGINIGDVFTFFCAIMIAFHVVAASFYQKKYDFDPALFVIINIYTSMVISVVMMLLFETLPVITIVNLWPLLVLGVFNTAFGFLVQSYALKISLPTRVSLIVAMEAVFAAIASWLILGEILTIQIAIGGFLIISGILITELKPLKKNNLQNI
ncbi:MAG: DMT family transporter [Candidatus Izimaplasma sp.]|nr:DMT family transporter [Candidatus Izimaplasma bacterium]